MDPTRDGYTFGGWYTDINCTKKAAFPYTVDGNVNFYAKWTKQSSEKITVDVKIGVIKGGKYIDDTYYEFEDIDMTLPQGNYSITVDKGTKVTQDMLPEVPETLTGTAGDGTELEMMFSFWNFERLAVPESHDDYKAFTDIVLFPVEARDADFTLYAMYVPVTGERATLTVHPNNGEEETLIYGNVGDSIAADLADGRHPLYSYFNGVLPIYEGHIISGYYKSADMADTDKYEIPFNLENTENHVYLRWNEQDDVTITYKLDGDTVYTTQDVEYNSYASRPESPFRKGYSFGGWYYTAGDYEDGEYDFDGMRRTSDVTLVARWVATESVTISFESNGGSDIAPIELSKGEAPLSLPVPSRYGYAFDGWYTNEMTTFEYTLAPVTEDITLYAAWTEVGTPVETFDFTYRNSSYEIALSLNVDPESITTLTLPETYNGLPVRTIADAAFEDCVNLTSVTLSPNIQSIGSRAFRNCGALREVIVPDGSDLDLINFQAFDGCTVLSRFTFQGSSSISDIYYIWGNVFKDSPSMLNQFSYDNSSGLYYWGDILMGDTFSTTTGYDVGDRFEVNEATSVSIRSNTRVIAGGALRYFRRITELYVPDSVEYISQMGLPSYASTWMDDDDRTAAIKSLSLPSGLKYMNTAVSGGLWLEGLFSPYLESIEVRGEGGRYKMDGDCLVDTQESRVIASEYGATSLPDGYRTIGEYAFMFKNIDTVNIPSSYVEIEGFAFTECAFTSLVIPDNVGILSENACYGCENLESISFGRSTPLVQTAFFSNANSKVLSEITVDEENEAMYAYNNILYNKATNKIIYVPALIDELVIAPQATDLSGVSFSHVNARTAVFHDGITAYPDSLPYTSESLTLGAGAPLVPYEGATWSQLISHNFNYKDARETMTLYVSEDNPYMYADEYGNLIRKSDNKALYFTMYAPEEDCVYISDTITGVADEEGVAQSLQDATGWSDGVTKLYIGAAFAQIEGLQPYIYTNYITEITVSADNPYYDERDNIVYTEGFESIVLIPFTLNVDELVLPAQLKEIPESAFRFSSGHSDDYPVGDLWGGDGSLGVYPIPYIGKLSVEEGSQLTSIGDYAFANDWSDNAARVASIDFTNATNLDYIGVYAFGWNEALTTAALPGVREIAYGAMSQNTSLTSLTLGEGVEEIGEYAFAGNYLLTSLDLPDSVQVIGYQAFSNSGILNDVYIDYDKNGENGRLVLLPTYWGHSYSDVSVSVPDGVEEIMPYAMNQVEDSALISVFIPDSVLTVGADAFDTKLDGLTIYVQAATLPEGWDENWNSGGNKVVWDCLNVEDTDADGNILYNSSDGLRYRLKGDGTATVALPLARLDGEVNIPAEVTHNDVTYKVSAIEDNAFSGMPDITAVYISEGITEIGDSAFAAKNSSLTAASLPSTITKVGAQAFRYTQIEQVTLRVGVEYGEYVYADSLSLQVEVEEGVTAVPEGAFSKAQTSALTLPEGLLEIGNYAFEQTKLTAIVLPSTLESIGNSAFNNVAWGGELTLPASVESIGYSAFEGNGITNLVIPENSALTEIGSSAFAYNNLTELTVPALVSSYGSNAFGGNPFTSATVGVKDVLPDGTVFGDALESIVFTGDQPTKMTNGKYSTSSTFMRYYDNLKHITFNEGLNEINDYAFYDEQLESITFTGSGALKIGGRAFARADIKQFALPENVTYLGDYALCGMNANKESVPVAMPASLPALEYVGVYAFGTYTNSENPFNWGDLVLGSAEHDMEIAANAFTGSRTGSITVYGDNITVNKKAFSGMGSKISFIGTNIILEQYSMSETNAEEVNFEVSGTLVMNGSSAWAFYNAKNLKKVTFTGSGSAEIGVQAFRGCTSLEDIDFTAVTEIGDYAFYGLTFDSIYLPSTVETVGQQLFYEGRANVTVDFASADERPAGWSQWWDYGDSVTVTYTPAEEEPDTGEGAEQGGEDSGTIQA